MYIPYPVFKPFADCDLRIVSKDNAGSLLKLPARSYKSCPLIGSGCRREEKDLNFRIAVFFDPCDACGKDSGVVENKQIAFPEVILYVPEYFVFSCPGVLMEDQQPS